jgi:hypothetical protein
MFRLHFFKRKRINRIFEGIDEVKKQQILAEIRLLRIQSVIAILTIFGVIIAFLILNLPQIRALFPKPRIRIEVKQEPILREGSVAITRIDDPGKKTITCPIRDAINWISLDPGSYNLSLLLLNHELWSFDYLLESGERKVIYVPEQFLGNIQVFVKNNTTNPLPEEMLNLAINVTGNGFLWVYELTKEHRFSRIYPTLSSSKYSNAIYVDKTFRFPDKDNIAVFAKDKEGIETMLFVVTSVMSEASADEIANRMTKITLGKASARERENNWGVAKITYIVERP